KFVELDGKTIAQVTCPSHHSPVFLRDGDRQEFYVRDGNQTRPLDVRGCHEYIRAHWVPAESLTTDAIRQIVTDSLGEQLRPVIQDVIGPALEKTVRQATQPDRILASPGGDGPPEWITIASRRVPDLFLGRLARSPGWRRIFLICPWLSEIEHSA